MIFGQNGVGLFPDGYIIFLQMVSLINQVGFLGWI